MIVDWHVVVVVDPDHTGGDFAYTVGLHDRGLPELFQWAQPTDGDDPGADWRLSPQDLMAQLNELGSRLVAETLAPGDTTECHYDGGATRATLILRQPVPAHGGGLEAFQAHADASVCEIRWTLHRTPVGPRRGLRPAEIDAARDLLGELVGEELAVDATFPADAPFGPHTQLFELLRTKVHSLEDHRAIDLLAAVYLGSRPEQELARIHQAGRDVGLVDELTRAMDLASEDATAIASRVFANDPAIAGPAANLFATIIAAGYGTVVANHAVPPDARGASEVLWALLDPSGARTRRFVARFLAVDPDLARVVRRPDLIALAAVVDDLDDDTFGDLVGLWPLAAAEGHGSGLWLGALLLPTLSSVEVAWAAGTALATAAYHALGIQVPDELGPEVAHAVERVAADVRAIALPHAS